LASGLITREEVVSSPISTTPPLLTCPQVRIPTSFSSIENFLLPLTFISCPRAVNTLNLHPAVNYYGSLLTRVVVRYGAAPPVVIVIVPIDSYVWD